MRMRVYPVYEEYCRRCPSNKLSTRISKIAVPLERIETKMPGEAAEPRLVKAKAGNRRRDRDYSVISMRTQSAS